MTTVSGIAFVDTAGIGFVNAEYRVNIAPACAGVNFLIIAFCLTAFYGLNLFPSGRHKLEWLAGSLIAAMEGLAAIAFPGTTW